MKIYRMNKPAGKWTEITEENLLKVINAHFEETEQTTWDGHNKPSRAQVLEYLKTGKTLHLYGADYKIEEECRVCNGLGDIVKNEAIEECPECEGSGYQWQ